MAVEKRKVSKQRVSREGEKCNLGGVGVGQPDGGFKGAGRR